MTKRILVGVAGTPALPSKIKYAVDLALHHGAEISVLSVVDVERLSHVGLVPIGGSQYAEDMCESRTRRSHKGGEDAIAKFEEACKEAAIPLQIIRQEGHPLEILAAAWRTHDICILGLRGWFDHNVVADPHDSLLKLIATGVRPILCVPEHARTLHKALIAYDGSMEASKAMKQYVQMNLWPGMEVHIACVGHPKTKELAEQLLAEAATYCRAHNIEPTTVHLNNGGIVSDELLAYAERVDADMIILGSSFRRMLLSQAFGRDALTLIRTADIPLFLSH